jgi:prolyl-tRNA synthetase
MGCYGIGINRILASMIEISHDENGMILPVSIAPWQVIITPAGVTDEITQAAEKIYKQLLDKGVEVLIDDRDVRGGVKFKDADILGIPIRVTLGKNSVAQGKAEMKLRRESENVLIDIDATADKVVEMIGKLKAKLVV